MTEPIFTDELKEKLQPGNKIRMYYNEGNPNNELRHIRAIVDEEEIVYKVWSKHKQRWRYHIVWFYDFLLADKHNVMTVIK